MKHRFEYIPENFNVRTIATQAYISNIDKMINGGTLNGGKSLGKIEMMLFKLPGESNSQFWADYPRRFYKHAKGNKITDRKFVDNIEEKLPGTRYILDHPLWLILENNQADYAELQKLMHMLTPEIQLRLFSIDKKTGVYTRKHWKNTRHLVRIALDNNLDSLACLLMLLREAEVLEKWKWYSLIKWYAYTLFLRLSYFKPLYMVAQQLNFLITKWFINRNNPLPENIQNKISDHEKRFYPTTTSYPYMEIYYDFLSGLLWHAQIKDLVDDDEDNQLRFLFWCYAYGMDEAEDAVRYSWDDKNNSSTISKIKEAYNAQSDHRYLPRNSVYEKDFS